jgi:RHS repeat-associated protein
VADPATGVVSGTAVYDSFGGRTVTGEAIRHGFTGREHDAESGLIHFRARAYDPVAGRFLQEDPVGFLGGDLNLYAYVRNQPETFTDSSGLMAATRTADRQS